MTGLDSIASLFSGFENLVLFKHSMIVLGFFIETELIYDREEGNLLGRNGPMIMKTERFHGLSSVSWNPEKADCAVLSLKAGQQERWGGYSIFSPRLMGTGVTGAGDITA